MSQKRQLAAIMFTDIVGYTALMQHNEQTAVETLHHFKEELNSNAKTFNGEIIQYYGDGCLLIFHNSADAINCARSLQNNFINTPKIPVRIGIHAGDILIEEGNIFGDSVNIAARIQSMSVPGGILFSDSIKSQIRNKPEFQFISLGKFEFKNVDEPMEVFALSNPGFPIPDKATLDGKFKETKIENTIPGIHGKNKKNWKLLLYGPLLAILIGGSYFIYKHFSGSKISDTQTTSGVTAPKSIAVLAFTDMSPDKSQEYLGDGLADDIITALSGIKELKVPARTSSFQFKGKNADLREIGDKLGVETILEGSVQKSGNILRITVKLINVEDGTPIWSDRWDRDMNDLFKVQDEIASRIREKLQISLLTSSAKRSTDNTAAYEDFLKGRRLLLTNIPENVKQARDFFLEALQKDPSFAEAIAFLSIAYYNLGTVIYPAVEEDKRKKALDSSFRYAQQAIALDEKSAAAHLTMAGMFINNYEWEKAEKEYRRAHELNPGTVEKNFLADFLAEMGQFEEAKKLAQDALVIDPLDVNSMVSYANVLRMQGDYNQAIREVEKIIRIDSGYMKAYALLGHCYVDLNKHKEALLAWAKQHEAYGNTELAAIYRKSDFKTAMQAWIKQASTTQAPFGSGDFTVALIHAYLKDKDGTLQYLEIAAEKKSPLIANIKCFTAFDFIRNDPRFTELYRKVGLNKYDEYRKTIK